MTSLRIGGVEDKYNTLQYETSHYGSGVNGSKGQVIFHEKCLSQNETYTTDYIGGIV